jgi:hypothetical protein
VLVVAGARGRITPAPAVRKVARRYKAVSTCREFENHAHRVLAEPGRLEAVDIVHTSVDLVRRVREEPL